MSKGWNWLGEVVYKYRTQGGVVHRSVRPPFAGETWPWPDRFLGGTVVIFLGAIAILLCWYRVFDTRWVNIVGLIFDIFGVGLLALELFLRPEPRHEEYERLQRVVQYFEQGMMLSAPDVDARSQFRADRIRFRRNRICGMVGLVLIGFGFLLQICAAWHPI